MRTRSNLLLTASSLVFLTLLLVAAVDPAIPHKECLHAHVIESNVNTSRIKLFNGTQALVEQGQLTQGELILVHSQTHLISQQKIYSLVTSPHTCQTND